MKYINLSSAILLSAIATTGLAQTFHVTKMDDTFDGTCDGDCSLREAIQHANQTPGQDTIYLGPETYLLSIPQDVKTDEVFYDENNNETDDFDITDDVVIVGRSMDDTIVKGTTRGRVFHVVSGKVRFKNLTITGGNSPFNGGGLLNSGETELYRSKLQLNKLSEPDYANEFPKGGGIANDGTLRIYYSRIVENGIVNPEKSGQGGGVYNSGRLIVRDSVFKENTVAGGGYEEVTGGALANGGVADIRRSLFYQNQTLSTGFEAYGTAISNEPKGQLRIVSSTISENQGENKQNHTDSDFIPALHSRNGSVWITQTTIVNNNGTGIIINGGDTHVKYSIIVNNGLGSDYGPQDCDLWNVEQFSHVGLVIGDEEYSRCSADVEIDSSTTFTSLLEPVKDHELFDIYYRPRPSGIAVDAVATPCARHDQLSMETAYDGDGDGVGHCDLGAVEWRP
ncbi:CSLREA domain-containing protein [Hahella ganghwensis]|uniref:CSLREA domain-containing protein n=1 Tax=Hahella ganghwensis TaxID=286420 RepID=UPI00036EDE80|nr:CSLREA domain-containing protein [Hahella ganghwensis]